MTHPSLRIEPKPAFIERYRQLTDYEAFMECSMRFLRKAIRVNTIKASVADLQKRLGAEWILTPVPWCPEGFWIEHRGKINTDGELKKRRDIGNLPEHLLGYMYVQEAASMIPPMVLDPQPDEVVLDLCAAPGSKTTQIAQYMNNTGALIANDTDVQRLASLGINVQRCGLTNVLVTKMQGQWFRRPPIEFDRVLVDAPCSGTGTIRKSYRALQDWSPGLVRRMAAIQKQLISVGFEKLKKGGTMVYSTCTLEPEENEAVVSFLLKKYPDAKLEKIELKINRSAPFLEFNGEKFHPDVKHCLRIWPQDNDSEGFFVAKIKKL